MKAVSRIASRNPSVQIARSAALSAAVIAALCLSDQARAHEPDDAQVQRQSQADDRAHTEASQSTVRGAQLYASPAQVQRVQEKLRAQGREPGNDGVWDQGVTAEVRDFQKANGLAPTGQLDTSLLSALELGGFLEGREASGDFLDGLLSDDERQSDAGSAEQSGAPIFVSPVHVAQIQHMLREEGHYEGELDGVWGSRTAQAANKYRQANGLEANDGIDIALLRAMNQQDGDVPKLAAGATSRTEGVPLHAGPSAIRALQRELSDAGHEAGDVDGVWGENTRQALREFQSDHELESTGTLTLPTLAALGVELTEQPGGAGFDARTRSEEERVSEDDQDAVASTEEEEGD